MVGWASRDLVFPPREVTVVPVLATHAELRREGAVLFKAAGWIQPRPTPVRIAALAPGVIEKLLVVEDQPLKPDQPVAELVKDDAKLAQDRAKADLRLREAELEKAAATRVAAKTRLEQPVHLQAPLSESEVALAKIKTQLKNLPFETRRAEAKLDFHKKDYEGKVAAKGAVSGRAIDEALSALDSAKALVEELRGREASLRKEEQALVDRRDALKKQLELLADEIEAKGEADAQVNAAQARLEQARVALAEASLRLTRMTIRAPNDGRIYKVYQLIGHPGARLGSGMTQMQGYDGSTVITLYRPDMLQVRVDVRFGDIPKVSVGQPVRIENPALSSSLTGHVLFTSSLADIQKNTLDVKVAINDPPEVFKPEMLVDVTFLAPKEPEGKAAPSQELRLHLPQSLVKQDSDGKFVWLADQSDGVARRTPVETGETAPGGFVEITRGLNVSSRIIATGIDGLQDGDRIKVTGEAPSAGQVPPGPLPNSSPSGRG